MSILASDISTGARALIDDNAHDHRSHDNLSMQANGANLVFQTLNRNILGSPTAMVNGSAVTVSAFNAVDGTVTLTAAPALDDMVEVDYYFYLLSEEDLALLVKQAVIWCGGNPVFTYPTGIVLLPDAGLLNAAIIYTAFLAAKKLAAQTAWFYSAGSGGKNFNKDSMSNKFKNLADELKKEAEEARKDPYTRFDRRNIPSTSLGNMGGFGNYTPKR